MQLRFLTMTIQVDLPEDIVARIDSLTEDRAAFVVEAVRNLLREAEPAGGLDETARINEIADELNREAADVLEYQVIP
jgi:metal-responsive CopG/Arc/MetJ family transcriptional regulator